MLSTYIQQPDLRIGIILVILGAGILCLLIGLIILISRGFSKEMQVLASTSTDLSKQAISHDLTALASSVSDILANINQMMATAAGVGAFLVLIGASLLGAAYWLTTQL